MAKLKGPMVDITWDDLEKMDAILEYCGTRAAAAKWIGVNTGSLYRWLTARRVEGVQFREEARRKITKLYKELDISKPVAATPRVPAFKGDHPLIPCAIRAQALASTLKDQPGEIEALRLALDLHSYIRGNI